ncbi:UPF0739 protein C1orf74 homolog [Colossoma macropomum]|uniref:UPF0739 protein C1orf74 homolog n=1 Tax=Colossoma macropomum TaxID=42526 RepID=UPI0018641F20|nr:UPF0739 protein C1orf74 homolog [Colossoma macropomum]
MVNPADIFISTAQKFLSCGNKKKRLPPSSCLDLAVQILAVNLGLKPAILYDSNAASAEQILQYVNSLEEIGLLSRALQIVSIDGNTLVVNSELMKSHLAELLQKRSLITFDVCPWREQPTMSGMESKTEDMVKDILAFLMNKEETQSSVSVLGEELYGQWNLCTLFGILLGYPASYWFDQSQGFENCLSMTPLVVNKVWVCWQTGDGKHCSCIYSFSVPEILWSETYTHIEQWTKLLRQRFSKQAVLTELHFSKETVILPSVTL